MQTLPASVRTLGGVRTRLFVPLVDPCAQKGGDLRGAALERLASLQQGQANTLRGEFRSFHDKLLKLCSFVQDELHVVREEVEEVRSDWAWHKCTLSANLAFASTSDARRIDMPKPDTYDGIRNATIVDNFLFGLDQYFDVMGIQDEASKVGTIPTYL